MVLEYAWLLFFSWLGLDNWVGRMLCSHSTVRGRSQETDGFIRKPASLPCVCDWALVFRLPFPLPLEAGYSLETGTLQSLGSWLHQGFSQQPAETHGDARLLERSQSLVFPGWIPVQERLACSSQIFILSKLSAVPYASPVPTGRLCKSRGNWQPH